MLPLSSNVQNVALVAAVATLVAATVTGICAVIVALITASNQRRLARDEARRHYKIEQLKPFLNQLSEALEHARSLWNDFSNETRHGTLSDLDTWKFRLTTHTGSRFELLRRPPHGFFDTLRANRLRSRFMLYYVGYINLAAEFMEKRISTNLPLQQQDVDSLFTQFVAVGRAGDKLRNYVETLMFK